MIPEQGPENGWEYFEGVPLCRQGVGECDFCGEETEFGWLEMEADVWACWGCFGELPDRLFEEERDEPPWH